MATGPRRHRVTIRRRTVTDSAGQVTRSAPVDLCVRFSSLDTRGGDEQQKGDVIRETQITHRLIVRRDTQTLLIREDDIVLFAGAELAINAVYPADGRNRDLVLACTQIKK